jgi:hypothetical protein
MEPALQPRLGGRVRQVLCADDDRSARLVSLARAGGRPGTVTAHSRGGAEVFLRAEASSTASASSGGAARRAPRAPRQGNRSDPDRSGDRGGRRAGSHPKHIELAADRPLATVLEPTRVGLAPLRRALKAMAEELEARRSDHGMCLRRSGEVDRAEVALAGRSC